MSRSSSSFTTHDASESGHTASLSRQPIQDSKEDPSGDEVNSIYSPTPTPTSVPSLLTRQGPRPDASRYPYMVTGVPGSHASGMTLEELKRMQYLYGGVRDFRIGVDCQAELLLEMLDIARRLMQQITRCICTAEGAIVISRRAWYLGLSVVILVFALVLVVALMWNPGGNPANNNQGCNPKEFYGYEGVVGWLSWIEGMESKLHISKCSDNSKVEYAACLL
ncbi:hypothetical protein Tco_0765593 [Tanacetum coccineum]